MHRTWNVALATSEEESGLSADDRSLLPALERSGILPTVIEWTRTEHTPACDAIVIRSVWDYHLYAERFYGWVEGMARVKPVWNDVATMRWNGDKRYLVELAKAGVTIPRTKLVRDLRELDDRSYPDGSLVLKPVVSAGAYRTVLLSTPTAEELRSEIASILEHSPVLVQEFMPEVASDGEYSFIFVDDIFTHAVVKKPRRGDFRVQEEHGGSIRPYKPSSTLIAQAGRVLTACGRETLYARVDGVLRDGVLVLMELELIEPSLYLSYAPATADLFAAACLKRLERHARRA